MTLPAAAQPASTATRRSLDVLFAEAERFGLLSVIHHTNFFDGTRYWRATIDFLTIPGTHLEAKGDPASNPYETIEQAIAKAEQIARQFR